MNKMLLLGLLFLNVSAGDGRLVIKLNSLELNDKLEKLHDQRTKELNALNKHEKKVFDLHMKMLDEKEKRSRGRFGMSNATKRALIRERNKARYDILESHSEVREKIITNAREEMAFEIDKVKREREQELRYRVLAEQRKSAQAENAKRWQEACDLEQLQKQIEQQKKKQEEAVRLANAQSMAEKRAHMQRRWEETKRARALAQQESERTAQAMAREQWKEQLAAVRKAGEEDEVRRSIQTIEQLSRDRAEINTPSDVIMLLKNADKALHNSQQVRVEDQKLSSALATSSKALVNSVARTVNSSHVSKVIEKVDGFLNAMHLYRTTSHVLPTFQGVAQDQASSQLYLRDMQRSVCSQVLLQAQHIEKDIKPFDAEFNMSDFMQDIDYLQQQEMCKKNQAMFDHVYCKELKKRVAHGFAAKLEGVRWHAFSPAVRKNVANNINHVLPHIVDERAHEGMADMPIRSTVRNTLTELQKTLNAMGNIPEISVVQNLATRAAQRGHTAAHAILHSAQNAVTGVVDAASEYYTDNYREEKKREEGA